MRPGGSLNLPGLFRIYSWHARKGWADCKLATCPTQHNPQCVNKRTFSSKYFCSFSIFHVEICLIKRITGTNDHLCMYDRWKWNKSGVINDPLGKTHSLASSEHCFHLKFVLFWKGVTDGRKNGHVQKQWWLPAVTVGRPRGSIVLMSACFNSLCNPFIRLPTTNFWVMNSCGRHTSDFFLSMLWPTAVTAALCRGCESSCHPPQSQCVQIS